VVKMSVLVFWVVTPSGLNSPEDGGSNFLRNFGSTYKSTRLCNTEDKRRYFMFMSQKLLQIKYAFPKRSSGII
jgi:hypothetical protein